MLRINPVDQAVGDIVQKIRDSVGESRDALAAKLCVAPEQVEMWELGYARIPAETLLKMSGYLFVNPSVFFSAFHSNGVSIPDSGKIDSPGSVSLDAHELALQVRMVLALRNIQDRALRESYVCLAEAIAAASQATSNGEGVEPPVAQLRLGDIP